jgi:ABC-type amino acid transport substrate-binding protein/heat shock protein HslJ
MKKIRYLIAILLLAMVVAGCSSPTPTPEMTTPSPVPPTATQTAPPDVSWQTVQESGVLRVGTTADYPPFEYRNEQLELEGFDIELIQQIGQKLNLKVELTDFPFDNLPASVAIGQIDVAIGALSVTPERQAIANFSNVYFAGSDAVLSRPDADPNKVQNPTALAAVRLGVQVNSIYETYAQVNLIDPGLMPKQNLFVYIDSTQALNDLKANRIDAVWMDLASAQVHVKYGGVKILVQDMNQQLYAIGMMKGADTLRDKINEALTQLQNDGTLANLQVKYLGIKPEDVVTPQPLPTNVPQPTPTPPGCLDGSKWVEDLSYDDNYHKNPPVLNPGQPFTKGWRIRNSGTCTWKSGYMMAYSYGNVPAAQMGGQPISVTKDVNPGDTFDFQVNLIAPVVPGNYQGYWNLRNAKNTKFGGTVWVDISVPGNITPTPMPTQTPAPNVEFTANPVTIIAGQPVYFEWKTDNVKFVYFYHDGQKWTEQQVTEDGTATEYPPYSMNYYLHADQLNGATIERKIWITVNPAQNLPVIEYISASPPQILLGESTRIDWSVSGDVDSVKLLIDNSVVLEQAPIIGNYLDAPKTAGTHVYTLQAFGPGGTNTQQTSVNVQPQSPTPTPVPDVPTPTPEPPTPTPEPTEPVVEPPVIQGFSVAPTTIEQGQCVTISWTTGGGTTRVELSRDAGVIWTGPELNNSIPDCQLPAGPATVQYTLVAYNNAEQFEAMDATVQVVEQPPQNNLSNTNWRLQTMQGAGDVPPEVTITAYFSADGSLTGSAGCNTYTASYIANDQVITIYPPAGTQMLCGDPMDTLELNYLGLLPQAANFQITDGQLIILGNTGQEILRYNPIE